MFIGILIVMVGFQLQISRALEYQTETIIDLYNKINTYGSLIKATSFNAQTQAKLKHINTVRMVPLAPVPSGMSSSFGIQIKTYPNERIVLVELRFNSPTIHIRMAKFGRRKFRLPLISTNSYDLTRFATHHQHRDLHIYIIDHFSQQITNLNLSLFYYSISNKNLFSLSSSNLSIQRRFRRTIRSSSSSSTISTCAKHEYQIDFDQFSFGQWILQPKRFNAYTCSGSCPNPLSPQYFPSNHAILLSLMRSQRDTGQQPSCVPVQLKPLCLLYYDRDELVIKYHRDMIVQECGCR